MKRLLLGLLVLLTLLLAAVGVAAWLLASDAGTRLSLAQLQRWLPGLQIGAVEGSTLGPLVLRELRYEDEGLRLAIDHVRLDWNPGALLGRRFHLRELEAGTVEILVKPQPPKADEGERITRLPIALSFRRAHFAALKLQLPDAEPLLFTDIRLQRARWVGRRIQLQELAADWAPAGRLRASAELELDEDGIDIDALELAGPGAARLEGRYAYEQSSDLRLAWKALRWPLQGPPQLQSPDGKLHFEGRPEDYRLQLQTALQVEKAALQLQAEAAGSTTQLRLKTLQARGLGGRLQAQGTVAWTPQLAVQAQGRFEQLNPGLLWPDLVARLSGDFAADTELKDGQPRIDFRAGLRDSEWRGHPLALQARGRYADDELRLHSAELHSADSHLKVAGLVWPRADAQAEFTSSDLAPLWPDLAGALQARVALRGPWEGPAVEADLQAQSLRYREYGLGRLQLDGRADLRGQRRPDRLRLQAQLDAQALYAADVTLARATLDADLDLTASNRLLLQLTDLHAGEQRIQAQAQLSGRLRDHRLQLAARSEQVGALELTLSGAGDLVTPRWRGALSAGHYAPPNLADWRLDGPAALELTAQRQSLEPACWRSMPARACLRLLRTGQGQRLAFRLEDFDVDYLQPLLPAQWSLDGRVDGSAQLDVTPAGDVSFLHADLRSSRGRWRIHEQQIFEFEPVTLQANQDARGQLQALADLPFAGGRARFEGRLAPGVELGARALAGSLEIDLPQLAWLRVFTPEVIGVEGHIRGRFTLGGTLGQPSADGALQLAGGRLRLARPGIQIDELNGSLRGSAGGPLQLALSGRSGGGELRASGHLDLRAEPMAAQLRIQGQDFQAARLPDARVWISPDLQVVLQKRHVEVSGEVLIPRAEITPRGGGSGIAPSDDQVIVTPGGEPPGTDALITHHARLRLNLGDDVRFNGFGLKAPLKGGVTLTQESASEARALGEIRLDGGRYKAYGQDLTITTGRLIYSGGFVSQPALDLRAERTPDEDVTVGVTVRGTLEKPQFALYSSPSMTQPEQLSWLVLGRPLEQSSSEGDRARLNGAAMALGLSGGDFLAQKLRGSLGVDEISIGAKPTESSEQARLTIGKYLSPKLYISYGIGLFQPGNIFKLSYELGRGFKVQTETGVESGGDLLYTIER